MEKFTINIDDKFYPEANDWMWDYCTFLGKFISSDGSKYDLGIVLKSKAMILEEYSLAIVYGSSDCNYISGFVYDEDKETRDFIIETLRRARLLNLIKK